MTNIWINHLQIKSKRVHSIFIIRNDRPFEKVFSEKWKVHTFFQQSKGHTLMNSWSLLSVVPKIEPKKTMYKSHLGSTLFGSSLVIPWLYLGEPTFKRPVNCQPGHLAKAALATSAPSMPRSASAAATWTWPTAGGSRENHRWKIQWN